MYMYTNDYPALEKYVGKSYFIDFNEVKIEYLLGGDFGAPFYLCRWLWSDNVFCASPLEILVHFDDRLEPIVDYPMEWNNEGEQ